MKSARLTAQRHIEIVEVPEPKIQNEHEVLVRVKSVGICGTDLHTFKGERDDTVYPLVMGHELSGVVEAVGASVTRVKPGDSVIYDPVNSCGHCKTCESGHENVCSDVKCFGVQMNGGFQELITVEDSHLYPFKKGIPYNRAALGEPFSIAANIVAKAQIQPGDKVVIFGAGTIGIATLFAARQYDAFIIVSDVADTKLSIAKNFGADAVINSAKEDLQSALSEYADGGVNVVIDAVGIAPLFEQAVKIAAPCARIVEIGFDGRTAAIAPVDLTKKELMILGSRMNCHRFDTIVEWLESGVITDQMISQVYPLEQLQQAFEDTLKNGGQWLKTMIEIG